MNRINPLYLAALLLVVLMMSIYLLKDAKNSLLEAKQNFKETQKIANELSGLKKAYTDKKRGEKEIKRILSQPLLTNSQTKADYKKKGVVISSEGIDKRALEFLMGKLFNSSYNIKEIKIKRLSEEKAQLQVEIKW